jgi:hypothetical protein
MSNNYRINVIDDEPEETPDNLIATMLLSQLRAYLEPEGPELDEEAFIDFMNIFEDLDEHLTAGKDLPSDWLEARTLVGN